jgi:hypothetical protein
LNNDTFLTAEGFYDRAGKLTSLEEIKKIAIQRSGDAPSAARWKAGDKDGKLTHEFALLGTLEDYGGVITSTYMVKDLATGTSQVLVLHSNYFGNGVSARGISDMKTSTQADPTFEGLRVGGCQ